MIRSLCLLACLGFWASNSLAATPALVRSGIVTAQTLQGPVAVSLTPVKPAPDVSLIVLTDTLTPESVVSLRREISTSFTSAFIAAHPLRIITVAGQGGGVSSPLTNLPQLQAAVKAISLGQTTSGSALDLINTLGGVSASLPSNWAHAVVFGRLPSLGQDELWASAWLGENYRKQHVRRKFQIARRHGAGLGAESCWSYFRYRCY